MKLAATLLIPAALMVFVGCEKKPKGPDWAISAPPGTVMAVSGQAGWVIQRREFQTLLGNFPLADRILDLFLKRAHINPKGETGRISLYVMDLQIKEVLESKSVKGANFLIQLGEFKDPKNLLMSITEAFPLEGSLQTAKGEMPLHVVLDYDQFHVRLLVDSQDRIWIGDLSALATLAKASPTSPTFLRAAQWVDSAAPIQGLLMPEGLLREASDKLPKEFAQALPKGIEALAWSVAPGPSKEAPHLFALAVTGSPEGIQQVAPWVQRLVALLGSMPGAPSRPADVLEERTRVGLKAELSSTQLEAVMSKISQPGAFKALTAPERKP